MRDLEKKFSSISEREQKLIFYTVPVVIVLVFVLGFIEPAISQDIKIRSDISNAKLRLATASNSFELLKIDLDRDPNSDTKAQIAGLEQEISKLEMQFTDELKQLVPPGAMPFVLEELFAKSEKLKLVRMTSIAPRNLFDKAADADAAKGNAEAKDNQQQTPVPALYRHGLQITFEGSFFDTRDFLVSIEQSGWKLHWQEVLFKAKEYPIAQVDIELFTLSMSEVYINVN